MNDMTCTKPFSDTGLGGSIEPGQPISCNDDTRRRLLKLGVAIDGAPEAVDQSDVGPDEASDSDPVG